MRNALLVALCLAAVACGGGEGQNEGKATATPPRAEDIPKYSNEIEPDFDTDNLLNLSYGAAVVSRTGEAALDYSAAHAIDGSTWTIWSSPDRSPSEELVFSLPAPARITSVGITPMDAAATSPTHLKFDLSSDGTSWQTVKDTAATAGATPLLFDISPRVAQYVRVRIDGNGTTYVRSVQALGAETRPPASPLSLAGCWQVNGVPARFAQSGATITGVLATDPPTLLDGGTTGRAGLFMWRQGPMWGYAVLTATPDGAKASGIRIHEEISTQQFGEGWFGERTPCSASIPDTPVAGSLETRAPSDRWSMYGLVFDAGDNVILPASDAALAALARRITNAPPSARFRLVAHELRTADARLNREHTGRRLEAMRKLLAARDIDPSRIEFVSAGSDWKEPAISTSLQRLLASRLDLERFGR